MNFNNDDLKKAWRVKAIIEKEYHKSHSVEELAAIAGTNKSTLNRLFHQVTQMPVKQYLLWFRIEIAKGLLTSTDFSIKHIAKKVGISRRNFERQFKKLARMTPLEWRSMEQPEIQDLLQKTK
jgi:AraC-like DNA-binding protein